MKNILTNMGWSNELFKLIYLIMTEEKLKLYNTLKTDEQCKSIIEKLEFWTLCKYKPNPDTWRIDCICLWREHNSSNINLITKVTRHFIWNIDINNLKWWQWFEIIWLPLSEHFIRLYINNLKFKDEIFKDYDDFEKDKEWYYKNKKLVCYNNIVKLLDNTKFLYEQSDECYNSICEALINL